MMQCSFAQPNTKWACGCRGPQSRVGPAPRFRLNAALRKPGSTVRQRSITSLVPSRMCSVDTGLYGKSSSMHRTVTRTAAPAPTSVADRSASAKQGVVIVGGGPAGFAAALMLARRGWKDITIVEQQADPTYADPDRSYVYSIDGRGRKFLEPVGLRPALDAASVSTDAMAINMVAPGGAVKQRSMSIKDPTKVTQWLPRTAFMRLLVEALARDPAAAGAVQVRTATRATRFTQAPGGRIAVQLEPITPPPPAAADEELGAASAASAPQGASEVLVPRLLLACDGYRSAVRAALASWCPGSYAVDSFPSLATGLRYKVLRLPPNPVTRAGVVLPNASFAVLEGQRSRLLGRGNTLRLGLLPVRDPGAPRTANLILLPDHPLWEVRDGEAMYAVFEESFPQMDWRALVPHQVMSRFAASPGGSFPAPQYTTHLAWTPPPHQQQQQQSGGDPQEEAGGTGVVLLGDAAHCFPPDLGQGVNSALEDVVVLEGALEEHRDQVLPAANTYQQRRIQDAEALARLMQVGYPLQYKQYPLRQRLYLFGFLVQSGLSKVLPGLVAPPIFMLVQDPGRSYSSIWKGAQRTRGVLGALAAAVLLGVALVAVKAALGAA